MNKKDAATEMDEGSIGTIHILRNEGFGTFSDPPIHSLCKHDFCTDSMAIRVVEFSNGGYKIRKVFA